MKFDIITIFPKIFDSYFSESIIGRAQKNGIIKIETHDLRNWTEDVHKSVDDFPYGGGPGMVMMVEPIYKAVTALKSQFPISKSNSNFQNSKDKIDTKEKIVKQRVILFSAKGQLFTQEDARRLKEYDQIIMICGRYEGVDERVAEHIADEELSVGNFVLTGGEIPAMIVVDAISRLLPGVLGKEESLKEESFSETNNLELKTENYLEYPQYTRPEEFNGWKVPEVLLSGNHKEIEKWRKENSRKQ